LSTELTALDLARAAARLALEKKALDVKILALKNLSSICDYFVIASGDADVQVKAIGRHIYDELSELGIKPVGREGVNEGNWVLLDYVDVVVHVFYEPTRRFYALEKLWGDAPTEDVTEEMITTPKR
jgi:ribosome-associated protein